MEPKIGLLVGREWSFPPAFIDEVNRHNHMMDSMGPIYSCNPCGEQFLHFSNSCNLGSIDLATRFWVTDTGTEESGWVQVMGVTWDFGL